MSVTRSILSGVARVSPGKPMRVGAVVAVVVVVLVDGAGNGAVVNGTSVSYAHVIGSSANLLILGILVSSSSDLITAAPT